MEPRADEHDRPTPPLRRDGVVRSRWAAYAAALAAAFGGSTLTWGGPEPVPFPVTTQNRAPAAPSSAAGVSPDSVDLTINGRQMAFVSLKLPLSLRASLDTLDAACRTGRSPSGLAGPLGGDRESGAHASGVPMVEEMGGAGLVVCFATSDAPSRPTEQRREPPVERKPRGVVSYAYALSNAKGETTVHFAHASDGLDPELFPETGDAAGSDVADGARPLDSVRLLTAESRSNGQAVRVYASARPLVDVRQDYENKMTTLGWTSFRTVAEQMPRARAFQKGAREVVVAFVEDEDHRTLTAVQETKSEEVEGFRSEHSDPEATHSVASELEFSP